MNGHVYPWVDGYGVDVLKRVLPSEKGECESGTNRRIVGSRLNSIAGSSEDMKARMLSPWVYSAEKVTVSLNLSPDVIEQWETGRFRDCRR
jgi:hypothetical protein